MQQLEFNSSVIQKDLTLSICAARGLTSLGQNQRIPWDLIDTDGPHGQGEIHNMLNSICIYLTFLFTSCAFS